MRALVGERLFVERLEDDLNPLLEHLAVGLAVEHRGAEGLDLAGVIAAPDAEHGAAAGQDVGGGEILGQAQRVPHRHDVEAAADFEPLGHLGQMHRQHQDVRNALVALVLKMMLGEPQRVVAEPVHLFGDRLGLFEDAGQMLVRIAPLIGRGRILAAVGKIDVAGIDRGEFGDHASSLRIGWRRQARECRVPPY